MPLYQILERSFIDGRVIEAGAVISYDGEGRAGKHWRPLEPETVVEVNVEDFKAQQEAEQRVKNSIPPMSHLGGGGSILSTALNPTVVKVVEQSATPHVSNPTGNKAHGQKNTK